MSLIELDKELVGYTCHTPKHSQELVVNASHKLVQSDESRRSPPHSRESFGGLSNGLAEAVAAGIAEGVAEGIAESLGESITNRTGGGFLVQAITLEGDLTGKAGALNIVKTVAELIAECVAYEVAQGLADGLAEAAAIAEQAAAVVEEDQEELDDSPNAAARGDVDGVLCNCGKVTVVRVMGKKSPNRGLRYLMCATQEPSFFKYKGKRKGSDAQNCRFFRWFDVPRHVKVDGNKERQKIHQKDLLLLQQQQGTSFYSTRAAAAQRGHVQHTLETPIPSTLQARDVSTSPSPPSKGPKASRALLGVPEANSEKMSKQTGRAKPDLKRKISLVSSTPPIGISRDHTRATAKRVAPIYKVVEKTLAGSEQQEDLHKTRAVARLGALVSAVSKSDGAVDGIMPVNIGNSNGQAITHPPSTHTHKKKKKKKKFAHQIISRTEAIEMEHKHRVSTCGRAGDSSSSGRAPLVGGDSRHATRSAGKKGLTRGKAETDSLELPPPRLLLPEMSGQVRKRRSFRAEVDRCSTAVVSFGGVVAVKRSPAVWSSSQKKLQHYTRRSSSAGQEKSSAEIKQNVSGLQEGEQDAAGHMMADKARANKRMEIKQQQSRILQRSSTGGGDLPARRRCTQNIVGQIDVSSSPRVEFGRRKQHSQSQQHRQQRELPLSEVYGTAEPLSSTKTFPQNASLQKSSPSSCMLIRHNDMGDRSKSSGKKRKQSQEYLLVDDFSPDILHSSVLSSATKKGKSNVELKEYSVVASGEIGFPWTNGHSRTETRTKAQQHALKLPDHGPPDDPWSLDGPWVEQKLEEDASGESSMMIPEIRIVSESCKDAEGKEKNVLGQTAELPETLTVSASQAAAEEEEEEEKEVGRQPTGISESSVPDSRKQEVQAVLARAGIEDMVKEDASVGGSADDSKYPIAVPIKRPRSVTASSVRKQHGRSAVEREGNLKPPTEAQWVDVQLNWRIEKSAGVKTKDRIVPDATVAPSTVDKKEDLSQGDREIEQARDANGDVFLKAAAEVFATDVDNKGADIREHTSGTVDDAISVGNMGFTAGEECELGGQNMKVVDASPPAEEDTGKQEHWTQVEMAKKTKDRAEASEFTAEAVKEADHRNVRQDGNGVQLPRFSTSLKEPGSVKAEMTSFNQTDQSKIQSQAEEEVGVPHCDCKSIRRRAVMKTVTRTGDANLGLRYWRCSNYRVTFVKKRKQPNEIEGESCEFFRWFDTPRVTAMEKKERRKEHYRQVELQRLL